MRPNLQPKICKSPVVAQQLYHMYDVGENNMAVAQKMYCIIYNSFSLQKYTTFVYLC